MKRVLLAVAALSAAHLKTFLASTVSSNAANAAVMALAFDLTRSRAGEAAGEHSAIIMAIRLQGGIAAGTMQVGKHRPNGPLAFLDSRLTVGTDGFAGQIGHLPISASVVDNVNADRPKGLAPVKRWECSCKQRDHLEGLASARALMRRLLDSGYELDLNRAHGPQLTRLLGNPDVVLDRTLHDIGRLVGRALASPILMLDPASITFSGYLAKPRRSGRYSRAAHVVNGDLEQRARRTCCRRTKRPNRDAGRSSCDVPSPPLPEPCRPAEQGSAGAIAGPGFARRPPSAPALVEPSAPLPNLPHLNLS